jgi:sialidase-1
MRSAALLSDDGGVSWRMGKAVPSTNSNSNEASIAELDDGTLVLSFRIQSARGREHGCRHFALSRDGGESWGPPSEAEGCAVPDPVCQGAILAVPGLGVVTSGPGSSHARKRMSLHRAAVADKSGLREWTLLHVLNEGAAAYSDLALVDEDHGQQHRSHASASGDEGQPTVAILYELGQDGHGGPSAIMFATLI